MSEKFRIEKRSNFTVVSNDILMNNFMSMKATCLLLKMLGKPDNWDYTISGMKTLCEVNRHGGIPMVASKCFIFIYFWLPH